MTVAEDRPGMPGAQLASWQRWSPTCTSSLRRPDGERIAPRDWKVKLYNAGNAGLMIDIITCQVFWGFMRLMVTFWMLMHEINNPLFLRMEIENMCAMASQTMVCFRTEGDGNTPIYRVYCTSYHDSQYRMDDHSPGICFDDCAVDMRFAVEF